MVVDMSSIVVLVSVVQCEQLCSVVTGQFVGFVVVSLDVVEEGR